MQHRQNNNESERCFNEFLQGWIVRQEHYLDELVTAQTQYSCDEELRALISKVLSHYQQYYEAKSVAASKDVFLVFSPTWLSSMERSFLWMAGFKPSLVFRIVGSSVGDLTAEQAEMLERLRGETKAWEKELEQEMAAVQESVAAPPLLEMARRMGGLVDAGERRRQVDTVIDNLRSTMQALVERADFLRATTTRKVIEILGPAQGVKLLAAAAQLQLRLWMWGNQKHAQSN